MNPIFHHIYCMDGSGSKTNGELKRPVFHLDFTFPRIPINWCDVKNGNGEAFFQPIIEFASKSNRVLMAVDVPFGLPHQAEDVHQGRTFPEWLADTRDRVGTQWRTQLVAENSQYRTPERPFIQKPNPGEKKNPKLFPYRLCDQKAKAEPIFFCSGARQVGKAGLQFWFETLMPLREKFPGKIAIWPFEDFEKSPVVVAECFPRLFYESVWSTPLVGSKENSKNRAQMIYQNLASLKKLGATEEALLHAASASDALDAFTMAAGVKNYLNQPSEKVFTYPNPYQPCKRLEGWILNLPI